jgi:hypothetical protein
MARSNIYNLGSIPPQIVWTVVRGDTASFRVYVTDDARIPLLISEWTLKADIKRAGTLVISLTPEQRETDGEGEFTVSLLDSESKELETGDLFDIQLSNDSYVWTVAQGSMKIIEDVTD